MRNAVTGSLHPLLVPTPEHLLLTARRSAQAVVLPPLKTAAGDRVPRIVEGVIVTGDVFMSDVARREELRTSLDAAAIEMEGAAVVQTCRQFEVSCLVVRGITDRADPNALVNYQEFLKTASENAASVATAIIGQISPSPQYARTQLLLRKSPKYDRYGS